MYVCVNVSVIDTLPKFTFNTCTTNIANVATNAKMPVNTPNKKSIFYFLQNYF